MALKYGKVTLTKREDPWCKEKMDEFNERLALLITVIERGNLSMYNLCANLHRAIKEDDFILMASSLLIIDDRRDEAPRLVKTIYGAYKVITTFNKKNPRRKLNTLILKFESLLRYITRICPSCKNGHDICFCSLQQQAFQDSSVITPYDIDPPVFMT